MGNVGDEQKLWIVPAPFFAMRYINNARYLPEDTMRENKMLIKPKENNLQFSQGMSQTSPKTFSRFRILSAHALRNIALGEKLVVQYGNNYKFHV